MIPATVNVNRLAAHRLNLKAGSGEIVRSKRSKLDESGSSKNLIEKCDGKCINKDDAEPPEPPEDYIHVRARRGQTADSHSLAERARREKISERLTLLQELVPGCSRITGKAVLLDEITNYALGNLLDQSKDFRHDTILLPRTCLDSQTHNSSRAMDLFKLRYRC